MNKKYHHTVTAILFNSLILIPITIGTDSDNKLHTCTESVQFYLTK